MALISVNRLEVGKVGVTPGVVLVYSTDSLATVVAAGYLNAQNLAGTVINATDFVAVTYNGGSDWFKPSISSGIITLVSIAPIVTTPTIANHLAVFTDVNGTLGEDVATAIQGGNLQAGLSGTAGTVASFPSAVTSGKLVLAAVTNSSGNFNTTISNASSVAQSQVLSIPDTGAATANFVVSKLTGTQHITVGSLQIDAGSLISGLATGGTVGTLQLFPTTTTTGSLRLLSAANGGNFNVDITNASHGQATVYTFADIGASTGGIPVATSAIRMKSVAQAVVAGGAAAQTVSDSFCTSGSMVVCTWNDTTNAVSIQKAVAGNGSFIVTSSGDPGASHLNYIITK